MKIERVPAGKPVAVGADPELSEANLTGQLGAKAALTAALGLVSLDVEGDPVKTSCSDTFLRSLVPDDILDRTFGLWRANPGARGLSLEAPGEVLRSHALTQPLSPQNPAALSPTEVAHHLADGYTLSMMGVELVDDALSELAYLLERATGLRCQMTILFGHGTALIAHRPYENRRILLQLAGKREVRFYVPVPQEPDHRRGATGPAWIIERGDTVVVPAGRGDRHHPLDCVTMHLEVVIGDNDSPDSPDSPIGETLGATAMRARPQVGLRDLLGQAAGDWHGRELVSRAPGGWHRPATGGGWLAAGWRVGDLEPDFVQALAAGSPIPVNPSNETDLRSLHRCGLVSLRPKPD